MVLLLQQNKKYLTLSCTEAEKSTKQQKSEREHMHGHCMGNCSIKA
jgi:hypothetical protein